MVTDIARDKDKPLLAADNLPYTTLLYADGPGGIKKIPRRNLTGVDTGMLLKTVKLICNSFKHLLPSRIFTIIWR